MNAKIQLFQEKKNGFFIDFFYISSQRSVVSSQRPEVRSQRSEVKTFLYLCSPNKTTTPLTMLANSRKTIV